MGCNKLEGASREVQTSGARAGGNKSSVWGSLSWEGTTNTGHPLRHPWSYRRHLLVARTFWKKAAHEVWRKHTTEPMTLLSWILLPETINVTQLCYLLVIELRKVPSKLKILSPKNLRILHIRRFQARRSQQLQEMVSEDPVRLDRVFCFFFLWGWETMGNGAWCWIDTNN